MLLCSGARQRRRLRQQRGEVPPAAPQQRKVPQRRVVPTWRVGGAAREQRWFPQSRSWPTVRATSSYGTHARRNLILPTASAICCDDLYGELSHGVAWRTEAPQALLTAAQVMHAAGFRVVGDTLVLDADVSLAALNCLLARLRCVVSNRGHSGDAEFFPLPGSAGGGGTGTSSPYLVSDLPTRARTAR